MKLLFSTTRIPYCRESTKISRNLNYPLWHLQDVLLPLFHKSHTYDSLRETIVSANHVWCAYEYGKCVGCALITDVGSNGGLYMLLFGIKRSEQGRGIGKYLLENIIRWSRIHGYKFIYLHTEHNNTKAIGMYQKAGFRKQFYQPAYMEQLPQLGSNVILTETETSHESAEKDGDNHSGSNEKPEKDGESNGASDEKPEKDGESNGASEEKPEKDGESNGASEEKPEKDGESNGASEEKPEKDGEST
ncbi:unnamed protein product, partial [Rotaria sp. Silwood2]